MTTIRLIVVAFWVILILAGCQTADTQAIPGPSSPGVPRPTPTRQPPAEVRVPQAVSARPTPSAVPMSPSTVSGPPTPAPWSSITQIDFVSSRSGWLIADTNLYRTDDGAYHWTQIWSAERPLISIDFVSNDEGWLATGSELFATTGGSDWITITVPLTSEEEILQIERVSEDTGWVLTTTTLYHTGDSGKTWNAHAIPCPHYPGRQQPLSFINADTGWYMCEDQPATIMQDKALWRTDTAGASWSLVTSTKAATGTGALPLTGYIPDIDFFDAQHAWMTLRRTGVYRTTNGGLAWEQLPISEIDGPSLAGPSFVSPREGFIVNQSQTKILSTQDGGTTFVEIPATIQ